MAALAEVVAQPKYFTREEQDIAEHRDQTVADIADLTLSDMAELNALEENAVKIDKFQVYALGHSATVIRAGFEPNVGLVGTKFAPRGGWRSGPDREGFRPEGEARELATGMSTKFWLNEQVLRRLGIIDTDVEIPVGGKTEMVFSEHPRLLVPDVKEQLLIKAAEGLCQRGVFTDRNHKTGPDMNMGERDMVVIRDTFVRLGIPEDLANTLITGLPVGDGGIAGRKEATARGAAVVLATYLQKLGIESETKVRFSLQGYGNAGSPLVDQFNQVSDYEGILSCVSDETGALYCEDGIDTELFKKCLYEIVDGEVKYKGVVNAAAEYQSKAKNKDIIVKTAKEDPDFWLRVEADCYAPSAMAGGINPNNVHLLRDRNNMFFGEGCIFVLPLANHGVSPLAQLSLERAGVRTVHHAHTNGYGVVGSLAQSAYNKGMLASVDPSNPNYLNSLLVSVASEVTSDVYDRSIEASYGRLTAVSLPMIIEAMRYQALARLYGRPNMAR